MKLIVAVASAACIASISALRCPASKNKKLTSACMRADSDKPLCMKGQCEVCHAGHGYRCYSKNKRKCCKYCPMAIGCPGEKNLFSSASGYSAGRSSGATCGNPAIQPSTYPDLEKKSAFSTFIVGGEDAVANSWPWQVSIRQNKYTQMCGGSILNENFVLTAAHCNINKIYHQVVTGDHRFGWDGKSHGWKDVDMENEEGTLYKIAEVYNHPDYFNKDKQRNRILRKYTVLNDFTIVKTATPMQFSDKVSPICLPTKQMTFTNADCVVTGWGKVDGEGYKTGEWEPTVLQQAEVKAYDFDTCVKYWGLSYDQKPKIHKEGQVCAGAPGKSACNGDSGGPLVCKDYAGTYGSPKWYLAGVVSFGSAECPVDPGSNPTIFGRVTYILDWIEKVTSGQSQASTRSSSHSTFSLTEGGSSSGLVVDKNEEYDYSDYAEEENSEDNHQSYEGDYDYSEGDQGNYSGDYYQYSTVANAYEEYDYEATTAPSEYESYGEWHDGNKYNYESQEYEESYNGWYDGNQYRK